MPIKSKAKKLVLHDALLDALNTVVGVLEPYVQSKRVPKEPVTEARYRAEGGFIYKHYHRRDYTNLCTRLGKEWENLPQIRKAVDEFTSDVDVQKDFAAVGFGNLRDYVANQMIHQFIYRILNRTRKWPPSRSAIEALFFEFEDYLLGSAVFCQAVVPLENFECETKKLILEPGVVIEELLTRDREDLMSRVLGGRSLETMMEVTRHRFAALIRSSWPKGTTQPSPRGLVERLLTALRLFKTGAVGANVAYKREPMWQPGHIAGGAERHIYTLPVQGQAYTLNPQEAAAFPAFWKWLYQQPLSDSAEVAIRWFNHGYQAWVPEDRIVSFVTGFESLFLRRRDSKGKSLARRIPRLLTNTAGRASVEQDVKDLWKLRSKVVHAERYQPAEAARVVGIGEYYLRESIRRYIEVERATTPNTHQDIPKWLDTPSVDADKQKLFPQWQAI